MDYNDIRLRLSRTLHSLNERFEEDIESYTKIELREDGKGISITFESLDEITLLNKIMTILYNLASLKDHLKNSLKKNGLDPQIVEDEINESLHLQVLMDIVNQEKHGSPLRRSRSNKNPVLRYPSMGFFPFSSIDKVNSSVIEADNGNGSMVIHALVKDDMENLLFRLDNLVETCFNKWESLAKRHGLI